MGIKSSRPKEQVEYISKVITWANYNKIALGYENGDFKADEVCTKRHALAFLYRYMKTREFDFAYAWGLKNGIINDNWNDEYLKEEISIEVAKTILTNYIKENSNNTESIQELVKKILNSNIDYDANSKTKAQFLLILYRYDQSIKKEQVTE